MNEGVYLKTDKYVPNGQANLVTLNGTFLAGSLIVIEEEH